MKPQNHSERIERGSETLHMNAHAEVNAHYECARRGWRPRWMCTRRDTPIDKTDSSLDLEGPPQTYDGLRPGRRSSHFSIVPSQSVGKWGGPFPNELLKRFPHQKSRWRFLPFEYRPSDRQDATNLRKAILLKVITVSSYFGTNSSS